MEGMSEAQAEFKRLFREHYAAIHRCAARRVESAAVQDLVAETFLTAWRRFDQVEGDPLPWLLGIARDAGRDRSVRPDLAELGRKWPRTESPASGDGRSPDRL
jgi:DNA-directed RNA polymerase specialized sigma24 family protein